MDYVQPIMDFFAVFWAESLMRYLLFTVVVNTVVGILAGVSQNEFSFQKLAEFLYRKILPGVGTYAIFWLFGKSVPDMMPFATASFAAIEAKLLADLAESLGILGVPWPDTIKRIVSKE